MHATWALYVDGQPVPGSGQKLIAGASGSTAEPVVVYGLLTGVAAGTHTVTMRAVAGGNVSTEAFGGDQQVEAVMLAG